MQDLFILPTPPQKTAAQDIVASAVIRINKMAATRRDEHIAAYIAFWDSPVTPDELLAELSAQGHAFTYLKVAAESARHMEALAGSVGKTIEEFLPLQYYIPRRAFVFETNPAAVSEGNPYGMTGVITLAPPAEGYDAWGRLIPIPEPEVVIPPPEPPAEEPPVEDPPVDP